MGNFYIGGDSYAGRFVGNDSGATPPYRAAIVGQVTDGASAIAVKIGNVNALSDADARVVAWYSDNLSTEIAFLGCTGALYLGDTLAISGNAARAAGMIRHTTANTAGNTLSVTAGGATAGATNKNGGNLLLYPGVSTGSGTSDTVLYAYPGVAGATSDNVAAEKVRVAAAGFGVGNSAPDGILCVGNGSVATNPWSCFYNSCAATNPVAARNGLLLGWNYSSGAGENVIAYRTDASSGTAPRIAIGSFTGSTFTEVLTAKGSKIGIGDIDPTYKCDVTVASDVAVRANRSGTATSTAGTALVVQHTTSDNMIDGFAARLAFNLRDSAAVNNTVGYVTVARAGADNTGLLSLSANLAGVLTDGVYVTSAENFGIAQSSFGTNAARVFGIRSGTAPTTSPADAVQLWCADRGGTAGKAGLHIRSEDGTSHVFSDFVGINTVTPSSLLDLEYAGTVGNITNFLEITNSANAVTMLATGTAILFRQFYYHASSPAPVDSGRIEVGASGNWTSNASTQDSYMKFSTSQDGALYERWTIWSNGQLTNETSSGTAYLQLKAGSTGSAPLKLSAGSLLTTADEGSIEFNVSTFWMTPKSTQRESIMGCVYSQYEATRIGSPPA